MRRLALGAVLKRAGVRIRSPRAIDPALAAGPARPYDSIVTPATLPGGDLIVAGLDDLQRGEETIAALLVSIGAPRLRRIGFAIPHPIPNPEERLYTMLAASNPCSAHGRFNALVRRLVSFERAAECAR